MATTEEIQNLGLRILSEFYIPLRHLYIKINGKWMSFPTLECEYDVEITDNAIATWRGNLDSILFDTGQTLDCCELSFFYYKNFHARFPDIECNCDPNDSPIKGKGIHSDWMVYRSTTFEFLLCQQGKHSISFSSQLGFRLYEIPHPSNRFPGYYPKTLLNRINIGWYAIRQFISIIYPDTDCIYYFCKKQG